MLSLFRIDSGSRIVARVAEATKFCFRTDRIPPAGGKVYGENDDEMADDYAA